MSVTIYGASDDLIELDGDIYEEFYAVDRPDSDGDNGGLVAFSDGTVIDIRFTKQGIWRILPVCLGSASYELIQSPVDDDEQYSDKLTLTGDISWAMCGTQIATTSDRQKV